jgi:predicted alpha/beta superfamily hydrolase
MADDQVLAFERVANVRGLYGGDPLSDGYLKFIVRELKPAIDRRFRVKTHWANTAIMGSSMGALISLYAIDEYPQVFGGAECFRPTARRGKEGNHGCRV